MTTNIQFKAMAPLALQTLTLANSTAVAANSTTKLADVLVFSVETNNVRARMDGTAPTLTTGVMFFSGQTYVLDGYNGTGALKFQRSTGTAKVTIAPFRYHAGV